MSAAPTSPRPGSPDADAELVVALREGRRDAFGSLFDAWCDRVHDVVVHVVRDPGRAGDAVHETFAVAWRKQEELDETATSPSAWLLRLARSAALDRHNGHKRRMNSRSDGRSPARVDVVGNHLDPEDRMRTVSAVAGATDQAIADLVWDAAAVLPARDLSVVDLELRHGLGHDDLAGILGMHTDAATQLIGRLHDRLDAAVRARVLWRSGSPSCSGLAGRLRRASIERFGPDAVRVIQRHVAGCGGCGDRQAVHTDPLAIFALLPLVPAPDGLRAEVAASLIAAGIPLRTTDPDTGETEAWSPAADDARRRAAVVGNLVEGPHRAITRAENPTALRATLASWAMDDDDQPDEVAFAPAVGAEAPVVDVPADVPVAAGESGAAVDPDAPVDLPTGPVWSTPAHEATAASPVLPDEGLADPLFDPPEPAPTFDTATVSMAWADDESALPVRDPMTTAAATDTGDGDAADHTAEHAPVVPTWGPTPGTGRVVRADASAPVALLDVDPEDGDRQRIAERAPLAVAAVVAVLIVAALSAFAMQRSGNNSPALAELNTIGDSATTTTFAGSATSLVRPTIVVPGAPGEPDVVVPAPEDGDDRGGDRSRTTTRDGRPAPGPGSPSDPEPGDPGPGPTPDPEPGPGPGPGPSTTRRGPVTTTTGEAPTTTTTEQVTTTTEPGTTTTEDTTPSTGAMPAE